jgi:hypothetical protein
MKQILLAPFNAIYRMFLWASGADLDVLDQAPTDKNKYFGIGGTIVFTALMASFAGGYAFYTAFKSDLFAVFFGLFWGALIFNLDRYIVSTFGVGDGKKTISRQELLEAAPRLLMACLLGFVIATPLELKIFETEIEAIIPRLQIQEKEAQIAADSTFYNTLGQDKEDLAKLSDEIKILQNDKKEIIEKEEIYFNRQLKEFEVERSQLQKTLDVAQNRVNSAWRDYNFAQNDETDRFGAQQIATYRSLYLGRATEKNKLKKDRDTKVSEIKVLKENRDDAVKQKREQIESRLALLQAREKALIAKVTKAEESGTLRGEVADNQQESYNGFAAHLEAMSVLTNEKPAIWWAKWLITLLFIFIEIAPILFKMMTERGPYDDIMDRIKHEVKVKQLLAQSNLNQWVNNAVKQNHEKNGQLLAQELASNEELMKQVAKAQAEIAAVAIEAWKEEQIAKMRSNPSQAVNSSNGTI